MSTIKQYKRIAIFHNLPGGGGIRMLENILLRYKDKYDIDIYVIGETKPKDIDGLRINYTEVKPWKGFIPRHFWIFFVLPFIHKSIVIEINKNYDLALLTHDYFTKSPFLLRYLKIDNIYLCQEPQREYYESWKIHAPNFKEKIVNIIRWPIKLIDEKNISYARKVLCNSFYSKRILKKIYKKKCIVIYPGVDEQYFKPGKTKKDNTVLCVGGINPVKDQLFLVNSLKSILDQYKLVLIGEGKKEYINKIIQTSGDNSNIEIVRNVSDSRLRSLYQKAMVTCISAHKEPFGLSSIESQACGTPVVSVREGGPIESIVNGKSGYLVDRNIENFREKVLSAIKNNNKMGEYARNNVIKNWSWEVTLKKLDKYLG